MANPQMIVKIADGSSVPQMTVAIADGSKVPQMTMRVADSGDQPQLTVAIADGSTVPQMTVILDGYSAGTPSGDAFLREGSGYILRQDGSFLLRE